MPGHHLHDTPDSGEREKYTEKASAGNQAVYVGAPSAERPSDEITVGLHKLDVFGHQAEQFPGAALAWNVGGMGIHWLPPHPGPTVQKWWTFCLPKSGLKTSKLRGGYGM